MPVENMANIHSFADMIAKSNWTLDVKSLLTVVSLVGSLAAAAVAAFASMVKYYRNSNIENAAQKQRQAVRAADEIDSFYEHPAVWLSTRIIDYENITINKSDIACLEKDMTAADIWNCLTYHSDQDLIDMRLAAGLHKSYSHDERKVRDTFDRFLTKLERIEKLISNNVIGKDDFEEFFSYWFQLMTEIPLPNDRVAHLNDERRRILWKYIRGYEYNSVIKLFAMYQRAHPVGTLPDIAFAKRAK